MNFKVDVVIRIKETVIVQVNTVNDFGEDKTEYDLLSMPGKCSARMLAATKAIEEVRSWDWADDQLGNVDGVSFEIAQPTPTDEKRR